MKIADIPNAPVWLKRAKVSNENVSVDKDGYVTWRGGTWWGGTWKGGTWWGGTWRGGTWRGGTIGRHPSEAAPFAISGLKWPVLYGSRALTIGCQSHTYEQWDLFSPQDFAAVHPEAWAWWQTWKTRILALRPVKEGIR